ncbi:SOS response-associated peptidase [Demequina sp.]|uniref:SOS response-associated peptidase n=1 Tax=Demequina sp. TaxID=2050685 RepID=UPI003D0F2332
MCGRYANFLTEQELIDAFAIATIADDVRLLPPNFNLGPMQQGVIIRQRPDGREAELAKWGLVPGWAKDPAVGVRAFNARAETVAEKPTFKNAFAKRRCIVPANGYFEWQVVDGAKTPQFIHPADGSPLAFAGLTEVWRPSKDDPWLVTFSIVTTEARGEMKQIHDREPVMLTTEDVDVWLDPESSPDDLFAVIDAPAPELTWHAVDKRVGNVRNNDADLIEPA